MMRKIFLLLLSFSGITKTSGQALPNTSPSLHIQKAQGKITLDGVLDEPDWQRAQMATKFWQAQPFDTSAAIQQTEARVTFDDQFLYISGKCYQSRKYVVVSLRRDFGGGTTDIFGVNLDTFQDKQNSFNFAVSPLGVQRDGLVANGAELSTDWDNKWYSQVRNYEDYWIVEMAIPFKTLRYKIAEKENTWFINFIRYDQSQKFPERSSWGPIPRNFNGNNLAFSGKMHWTTPPPKPGANISLIPYFLGESNRDVLADRAANTQAAVGFDAKVAVTPSLNLDLTVNPDFAQVEVDRQVQNLTRFEVAFPERRQFFLENSDLFATFGFDNITPFFSRRVGLAYNPVTDQNEKVPILFGARLSGKINNDWRLGFLTIQTASKPSFQLPGANFLMAALQRRVFTRSNVSFFGLSKQNWYSSQPNSPDRGPNWQDFTRIVGGDFNFFSTNGAWTGKVFYHRAFAAQNEAGQYASAGYAEYSTRRMRVNGSMEMVGENYDMANATGYVTRFNYLRTEPNARLLFYPKSGIVNNWAVGIDGDFYWRKTDGKLLDYDFSPVFLVFRFQSSAQLNITPFRQNYTYLFDDFDPTRRGGGSLAAGNEYIYRESRVSFNSNARNRFYFNVQSRFGQFFAGNLIQINTNWNYRYQPYGVFSMEANYNHIRQPYGTADLWLIGPRADVSFNRDVFLTALAQYNNLSNNINLNVRFQWRFRPVSDLFVVYTENYFADSAVLDNRFFQSFATKNRALVLKLTYWLNV
jgi:Domain of unknown function (DUF5916)